MSRALLRSALELRTPITRLPPAFLLPIRSRSFNTTTPIIEPVSQDAAAESAPSGPRRTKHYKPPPVEPRPRPEAKLPQTPIADSVRELLPLLRAQPEHYITIHIHARPYLVTAGDSIRLPFRMPGVLPGDVLRLTHASVVGSRDLALRGAPYVDSRLFECRATVLGVESEPLRLKVKKKQRNRRSQTIKSKHRFTILRVSELKIRDLDEVEAEAGKVTAGETT